MTVIVGSVCVNIVKDLPEKMLLSEACKFIFLKTHKTASTTVELALEPFCAPPDHQVMRNRKNPLISEYGIVGARAPGGSRLRELMLDKNFYWHHMSAKKVLAKIGKEKFFSFDRLTTIRNPFSRLVSMFYFQQACNSATVPEIPHDLGEARVRFGEWLMEFGTTTKKPFRAKTDHDLVHFNNNLVITNYIRVENIREDLDVFCRDHGIDVSKIKLTSERDNSVNKKFKAHELFYRKFMVDQAHKIDEWVFNLDVYPELPRID